MTHYHDDTVVHEDRHETVEYRSSSTTLVERGIVFVFGLIQALLLLRVLLLLLAAREGNDIVAFIYGLSEVFVAPFRGMLRLDQIAAGQTALDVAAIVALIGWTILELVLLAAVRLFRR
jgi:uncharacterized protein YggT (Ycf19 family)